MNKKFVLSVIFALAIVLSVTNVLAISLSWATVPSTLYRGENKTASYNITNDNVSATIIINSTVTSTYGFSTYEILTLPANASVVRTVNLTTNSSTLIGPNSITLTTNASATLSGSFDVIYPYCDLNSTGSPVTIVEITNDEDIIDKDFKPLDTFAVKVKVKNMDNDDSHRVVVNAVLVNHNDEISDTDIEESAKVSKDHTSTITLNMKIPADADEGTIYLYVKAYNDDDETNCYQRVLPFQVEKSSHEVLFDQLVKPINVSCGSVFNIKGKVSNIGVEDEDKVKVEYSDSFGASGVKVLNDLGAGEDASISFSLNIPSSAVSGLYSFNLTSNYRFNEDEDDASLSTYDENAFFSYDFDVYCTKPTFSNQTIKTEASTAILGIASEVRATLTNTGTVSQTYAISANADWATISSVTPSSVILGAGESREIVLKVQANEGTSIGTHNLVMTVQSGIQSESKTIPVVVQQVSQPSSLTDKAKFYAKSNPIMLAVNIVLGIVILIVAFLLLTKKSA